VAPVPEKNVTLHQGCCSSRQTVLAAMSLTQTAKSVEKERTRKRRAPWAWRVRREEVGRA